MKTWKGIHGPTMYILSGGRATGMKKKSSFWALYKIIHHEQMKYKRKKKTVAKAPATWQTTR